MFHVEHRFSTRYSTVDQRKSSRYPVAASQTTTFPKFGSMTKFSRVVAVANQKGGVGKTTTTINLAASLALADRRVLLVDVDPQANLTSGIGLKNRASESGTIYDAL